MTNDGATSDNTVERGALNVRCLQTLGDREIQGLSDVLSDVLIDCVEGGAALLAALERNALGAGKTLLVLDTVTGSDGERLYAAQGWQRCGEIPGYALWPDGTPCATTIFFRFLK